MEAVDRHVPSKVCRKHQSTPWINCSVRRLLRRKKRLYKKAKTNKNWSKYYHFQKECRRSIRKAEWELVCELQNKGRSCKQQHKAILEIHQIQEAGQCWCITPEGPRKFVSDTKSKTRLLLNQFKSVFTFDDGSPMPETTNKSLPHIDPITVTTDGVAKLLRDLNASKAPGPDNIPSRVLKQCAEQIAPALCKIFQKSLDSGELPSDWRKANVTLLVFSRKVTSINQGTIDQYPLHPSHANYLNTLSVVICAVTWRTTISSRS